MDNEIGSSGRSLIITTLIILGIGTFYVIDADKGFFVLLKACCYLTRSTHWESYENYQQSYHYDTVKYNLLAFQSGGRDDIVTELVERPDILIKDQVLDSDTSHWKSENYPRHPHTLIHWARYVCIWLKNISLSL